MSINVFCVETKRIDTEQYKSNSNQTLNKYRVSELITNSM